MPKIVGTFTYREGKIFRKETYIQWGNSDRSLGCFVGLNPGSAKLMNPELRQKVERGLNVSGEVLADPTIRQMIAFVESIGGADVSGRLSIYNLFYLQDPKARRAVKVLEDLHSESYDLEGEIPSIVELQLNPWILVSWGLEDKPHVKDLKRIWLARMQESGVPYFGKVHAYKKDYYHICPQLVENRREIIDNLTCIYRSI